jgi:phosphopantetheine--protein transferase-like protein
MTSDDGVVAEALVLVDISEVTSLIREGAEAFFTARELAYARAKSDPERRLAARLAAKKAASQLLGAGLGPRDVEVVRGHGPPTLHFSRAAQARLAALGATRAVVSLTHERQQAAASVLLLRDG